VVEVTFKTKSKAVPTQGVHIMQLQISHIPPDDDPKKPLFQAVRLPDGKRTSTVVLTPPNDITIGESNQTLSSRLRWYLENYLNMPLGGFDKTAEDVQNTLREWGRDCFEKLFSGHARDWFQEARRNGLENLSIKITSDDPSVLSWPWEALY
jgi:hypothetical protein